MSTEDVGPVLENSDLGRALVAAMRELQPALTVEDHGAYLRVRVPRRCVVQRAAVERALGRPFRLPGDLEAVMPSFKGNFHVGPDEAVWAFGRR
jgi:toluene monooxygenase system protein D